MYILAGLGNPSLRYRHTRHNAGFDALDVLAKHHAIRFKTKEHFALTGEGKINGEDVLLVKPQTYMNRSGESLRSLSLHYGICPDDRLIVLVDDIHLEAGMLRIRTKGSAGGHNGLKSIIACLNTESFSRIRIGVGKMPREADQIKYVLSRPKGTDLKSIRAAYEHVADACSLMVAGETQKAMNDYNGRTTP